MYVTGIGSRSRPIHIRDMIENIMSKISASSVIRSGAASGCDSDFEDFAISKEIFLPWKGFNNNDSQLYLENMNPLIVEDAKQLIKVVHPAYNKLSGAALKLHIRNAFQVLGKDLTSPSSMVICYTPNGEVVGGTATAIRIARLFDVPVYNLGSIEDILRLIEMELCDETVLYPHGDIEEY